jgi:AcrR family transcriptional regulator
MAATGTAVLTPAAARVLDVASRLFYERGIHAVGVDAIAEAAGVTKKTIYDRFRSKDNLITAYLERRDRRYRERVAERVAGCPDVDPVLVVFDALGEWLAEHGSRGCAFVNAFGELADPDHPAHRIAREEKAWLRETFRDLAASAGHADAAVLADRLLLLHEGAVVLHSAGADPHAVGAARDAAAALLAPRG